MGECGTYTQGYVEWPADKLLEHVEEGRLHVLDVRLGPLVLRVVGHHVARVHSKSRRALGVEPRQRRDGLQQRQAEVVGRVAFVVTVERRRQGDGHGAAVGQRRRVPAAEAGRAVALGAGLISRVWPRT